MSKTLEQSERHWIFVAEVVRDFDLAAEVVAVVVIVIVAFVPAAAVAVTAGESTRPGPSVVVAGGLRIG